MNLLMKGGGGGGATCPECPPPGSAAGGVAMYISGSDLLPAGSLYRGAPSLLRLIVVASILHPTAVKRLPGAERLRVPPLVECLRERAGALAVHVVIPRGIVTLTADAGQPWLLVGDASCLLFLENGC